MNFYNVNVMSCKGGGRKTEPRERRKRRKERRYGDVERRIKGRRGKGKGKGNGGKKEEGDFFPLTPRFIDSRLVWRSCNGVCHTNLSYVEPG